MQLHFCTQRLQLVRWLSIGQIFLIEVWIFLPIIVVFSHRHRVWLNQDSDNMTISYQWLRQYIDTALQPDEIAHVLTSIGLEVESMERIESVPGGLQGIVVGEVLTCEKHPDADRLRLTTVNVGGAEPLQIVCGAPNVAAGQKVLVATIGAKLYPSEGEPFVIKKGKIRGAESHGMICAEDELGLGQSHDGIMVLDAEAIVGSPAAVHLKLESDLAISIGLTPNRTDAFSHYGVARDLYTALRNMPGSKDTGATLKPIETIALPVDKPACTLSVTVSDAALASTYSGVALSGLTIGPSPEWLCKYLTTIGLKPINNVVDVTNFVQHEMGQPIHAFDVQKIRGKQIQVRMAHEGETLVTLDQVNRTLSSSDLIIADASGPICLAGVLGGIDSGVSSSTTSIFIESACFNPVLVRKTARRHTLNTDASFRFERGTDPLLPRKAMERAVQLILEVAGGEVTSSPVIAIDAVPPTPEVQMALSYFHSLIGFEIPQEVILSILHDLDMHVTVLDHGQLMIQVPHYRTDVRRPADVVEEVLRIYGYNNIPFPKGLRTSLSFAPQPDPEAVQRKVAEALCANGFHETMSMSLTKSSYASLVQDEAYSEARAVAILNPLSGDLAHMRTTLLYAGLENIAYNQNHRQSDLRLFEFGKEYRTKDQRYFEETHLALFITGRKQVESWNTSKDSSDYYDLKGAVDQLMTMCGLRCTSKESEHAHFDQMMELHVGKKCVARVGIVSESMQRHFDVKQTVYYADILWENVLASLPREFVKYSAPEKFPAVRRDLSLLVEASITFDQIRTVALETERKLLRKVDLFDVYEGKNLEAGKKSYAVSFILQDPTQTMTDQQTERIMGRILEALTSKLGAALRS
jgi:phenylalanyl-tRNA synthetase beta chain